MNVKVRAKEVLRKHFPKIEAAVGRCSLGALKFCKIYNKISMFE